jgi:hypothetical protein
MSRRLIASLEAGYGDFGKTVPLVMPGCHFAARLTGKNVSRLRCVLNWRFWSRVFRLGVHRALDSKHSEACVEFSKRLLFVPWWLLRRHNYRDLGGIVTYLGRHWLEDNSWKRSWLACGCSDLPAANAEGIREF